MTFSFCSVEGYSGFLARGVSILDASGDITFPDVEFNMGESYNSSTGVFTCPLTGLYWMSAMISIVAFDNANDVLNNIAAGFNITKCDLIVGGKALSQVYTLLTTSTDSLMLPMRAGDTVRIGNCLNPQRLANNGFTHFSAMLIVPFFDEVDDH